MSGFQTRMAAKRNELLSDLVALAEEVLQEYDVAPTVATIIANALADRLADHWGGQNISFPKDFHWKLAQLELEIYDAFNGRNYDELARRYQMTERGIRKLIARARSRITAIQQPSLFDAPVEEAGMLGVDLHQF